MKIPFKLPIPKGCIDQPIWTGSIFECGDQTFSVLEYSENFEGWSDDLTALHEVFSGETHPIDLASRADAIKQLERNLPQENPVIMEIGCSSGFLIREIVGRFPEAVVIGADVVKAPLLNLAKVLPHVPLMRIDLLQNSLPDSSIDVLIMLNVLEHIQNDILALRKAYKLLKPGGTLIIEVPAGQWLYDSYDAQLLHFRRYSKSDIISKLKFVGFKIVRQSHLGFIIFPLFVAVKLLNKFHGPTANVMQGQVTATSKNWFLAGAMRLEERLQNLVSLPFGVRLLITAKRLH